MGQEMMEEARERSRRAWLRALIRAVAVADGYGTTARLSQPPTSIEIADSGWPAAFLRVAQACAAGKDLPPLAILSRAGESMGGGVPTPLSLEARLLIATPELLLNTNHYGHRRTAIQSRGVSLGFEEAELAVLDEYFQLLCQGLRPQGLEHGDLVPVESVLAPLQALVQSSQGQFWLALALAQQRGMTSAAQGLVGLLAILSTGPAGLPLALCHRYLRVEVLGDRWLGYDEQPLAQLADGLYQYWAGVGRGVVPQRGTAYNG